MKLRIKNKHLKQKEKLFSMLRKEGYEVNDDPIFFNVKLRLGLGELDVIDCNGKHHLCRYGHNKDNKLAFVEEETGISFKVSEVLGYKKVVPVIKKEAKLLGITFNVIKRIESSLERSIKDEDGKEVAISIHYCEITDKGHFIFGFFDKNDELNTGKYLGPDFYNSELSYKEAVKEELKRLSEEEEFFVNNIKEEYEKLGFDLDDLTTNYANKLKP